MVCKQQLGSKVVLSSATCLWAAKNKNRMLLTYTSPVSFSTVLTDLWHKMSEQIRSFFFINTAVSSIQPLRQGADFISVVGSGTCTGDSSSCTWATSKSLLSNYPSTDYTVLISVFQVHVQVH